MNEDFIQKELKDRLNMYNAIRTIVNNIKSDSPAYKKCRCILGSITLGCDEDLINQVWRFT